MNEMPQWHGYTLWHAVFLLIGGWVTHANWPKLVAGYRWIQGEGGAGMILKNLIWNPKAKSEQQQQINK
jgi:hypothetical protein